MKSQLLEPCQELGRRLKVGLYQKLGPSQRFMTWEPLSLKRKAEKAGYKSRLMERNYNSSHQWPEKKQICQSPGRGLPGLLQPPTGELPPSYPIASSLPPHTAAHSSPQNFVNFGCCWRLACKMPTKSNDIPGKAKLRELFRKLCLEKKECRTDNIAVYKHLKDLQKAAGVRLFQGGSGIQNYRRFDLWPALLSSCLSENSSQIMKV